MAWIAYVLAGMIILLAAWIVVRRVREFVKTKGMSACENCPYANACGQKKENCRR